MNKKITSKELAVICGVSQGTVDRAMNNRPGINPETKRKILEAAKKHGYFPDIHAGKLAGGKSRLIGIVVFGLENEYFSELVCALDLCCRNMGYTSVTMFSGKDSQTELDCIRQLVSIGVDGLVLCCVNNSDAIKKVIPKNLPAVAVGNRLKGFPYCGIDDYEAMKALCQKAIDDGHSLCYYSPVLNKNPKENISAQILRYKGYCDAVGITDAPYCVSADEIKSIVSDADSESEPAIICSTDHYALKIIEKYPGVKVYCFDCTRILKLLSPRPVSVGTDASDVAANAVKIICGEAKGDVITAYSMR